MKSRIAVFSRVAAQSDDLAEPRLVDPPVVDPPPWEPVGPVNLLTTGVTVPSAST